MNKDDLIPYDFNVITYTKSQNVSVVKFCNGLIAINTGDTPVRVAGKLLQPRPAVGASGESYGPIGNLGEVWQGKNGVFQIAFEAPLGTAPSVDIIQKYYLIDQYE